MKFILSATVYLVILVYIIILTIFNNDEPKKLQKLYMKMDILNRAQGGGVTNYYPVVRASASAHTFWHMSG